MSNLISKTDELSETLNSPLDVPYLGNGNNVDTEFYTRPRGPLPLSLSTPSTEAALHESTTPVNVMLQLALFVVNSVQRLNDCTVTVT